MYQILLKACCAALAAAAMIAFWLVAVPDEADAAECAPYEMVKRFLSNRYQESRKAMGVVATRGIMELYVSEESGTWTVLLTMPNGMSCIVAAGDAFETETAEVMDPAA